jgi:Flp pilus assembly pilin Flp
VWLHGLPAVVAVLLARYARPADRDAGASLVEYTLLLSLIAIAAFGAMSVLGEVVKHSISNSAHTMFPHS